jgi:hypothetical protein
MIRFKRNKVSFLYLYFLVGISLHNKSNALVIFKMKRKKLHVCRIRFKDLQNSSHFYYLHLNFNQINYLLYKSMNIIIIEDIYFIIIQIRIIIYFTLFSHLSLENILLLEFRNFGKKLK